MRVIGEVLAVVGKKSHLDSDTKESNDSAEDGNDHESDVEHKPDILAQGFLFHPVVLKVSGKQEFDP